MIRSGSATITPSCAEISVGLPQPISATGPTTVVPSWVGNQRSRPASDRLRVLLDVVREEDRVGRSVAERVGEPVDVDRAVEREQPADPDQGEAEAERQRRREGGAEAREQRPAVRIPGDLVSTTTIALIPTPNDVEREAARVAPGTGSISTNPPPLTTSDSIASTMRVGGRKRSARSQIPRFGVPAPKVSAAWTPSPSTVTSNGPKRSSSSEPRRAGRRRRRARARRSSHVSDSGPNDRSSAIRFSSAAVPLSVSPRSARPAEPEVELDVEVDPAQEGAQERVALASLDDEPRTGRDHLDPVVGLVVRLERQPQRGPREVEPGPPPTTRRRSVFGCASRRSPPGRRRCRRRRCR